MPSIDDVPDAAPDIYRGRFESCFREHYPRLLAFTMRRVSGREAAEEVVADIYAVAWRRRDHIPDRPLPWLYAIAANVIADQYRSTRRRHDLGLRLAHEARVEETGSDPAESLALRDAFAVAFARLTEPEREVLRLVAWDGLDVREAARVLGCSQGAFRVRLHRARRKLARHLDAPRPLDREGQAAMPRPAEEAR
ncbi:MAG: sigma-70 family RNA polymerase sigma factor [Actinobacteria bacterium]|nr:sigma-70 family RNA polymerase sigma factor [Actinomycetota bacterium]